MSHWITHCGQEVLFSLLPAKRGRNGHVKFQKTMTQLFCWAVDERKQSSVWESHLREEMGGPSYLADPSPDIPAAAQALRPSIHQALPRGLPLTHF